MDKEKIKVYNKQYYIYNKKKSKQKYLDNKEKIKEYSKEYYLNNKEKLKYFRENNTEKIKEKNKKYYLDNKENSKAYCLEYRQKNKDKINIHFKNRRRLEPLFKLRCNIGKLIRNSITKQGYKKESKTFKILGCSYEEFKQHLERHFTKGMTWENQGKWHLDHIYPVSLAKDEQELIRLNHYANFQPMWAAENISKGNKIIPNTQIKLI